MGSTHTMEYYSALKKEGDSGTYKTWINLEDTCSVKEDRHRRTNSLIPVTGGA